MSYQSSLSVVVSCRVDEELRTIGTDVRLKRTSKHDIALDLILTTQYPETDMTTKWAWSTYDSVGTLEG